MRMWASPSTADEPWILNTRPEAPVRPARRALSGTARRLSSRGDAVIEAREPALMPERLHGRTPAWRPIGSTTSRSFPATASARRWCRRASACSRRRARNSASRSGRNGTTSPPATTTLKHDRMMPEDWKEQIGGHDAIFFGAVGWPEKVPDHISLWGSLILFRREFDQYVNLRPVRLMPGVRSPLADRKPGDIDFWVVRENTEGEYSSVGGRMFQGTEREFARAGDGHDPDRRRPGAEVRLRARAEARRRSTSPRPPSRTASRSRCRIGTSASKAMAKRYPDVALGPVPHRHPDRAFRAAPGLVRRRRRLEPVRRHPLRPRPGLHRHDRHRAVGQHQPGAQVPLACSSRCTARRPTSPARASPTRSGRSGPAR